MSDPIRYTQRTYQGPLVEEEVTTTYEEILKDFDMPCLVRSLVERCQTLEAERAEFHVAYRMKCDVETKQLEIELAALRQRHAEAVELFKSIEWHQDGDSSIYVCAYCRGMHPACEQNGNWIAGTKFGHKSNCLLAKLLASEAKARLT